MRLCLAWEMPAHSGRAQASLPSWLWSRISLGIPGTPAAPLRDPGHSGDLCVLFLRGVGLPGPGSTRKGASLSTVQGQGRNSGNSRFFGGSWKAQIDLLEEEDELEREVSVLLAVSAAYAVKLFFNSLLKYN